MRILHLVHQYPPHFTGGTELYTQMLATAQAALGHQVVVFCPSPDQTSTRRSTVSFERGVRVIRYPLGPRSRTKVFRDTFRQQELQQALAQTLDETNPDLVHIQHLMGMPMSLADQVVKAGVLFLLTLHDYWYICANAQLLTNTDQTICPGPDPQAHNCARCAFARAGREGVLWAAPALAPLMRYRNQHLRKLLQSATYVIAPTEFVRQTYIDQGLDSDNLVVVHHGIEHPRDSIETKPLRRRLSDAFRPLQIGFLGSISWQKGVHVLIEAVNELAHEDVRLVVYGDSTTYPTYTAQLKQQIQWPNINFAGPLSRQELWPALADLDLAVLPTLWYETSSLVLDEAFAAGVPVVVTDIGVMADKVLDGFNGRLFPLGDARALTQILQEIIANPGLLENWREGIPPVRTIDDHVKQIEELYQSTLDTV